MFNNNPQYLSEHLLELSVHQAHDGAPLRAILWDGRLTRHDDTVKWTATWTHGNFFRNVASLRQAVEEELKPRGGLWSTIQGIDTLDACWPIHNCTPLEEVYTVSDALPPKQTTLHLAIMPEGKASSVLYTPSYELSEEEKKKALCIVTYRHRNIFEAFKGLRTLVRYAKKKYPGMSVNGLDDDSSCWPHGL